MKKLFAVTVTAFVLVGCATTPATQIQSFGDSAKEITEKVDSVFTEYNQAAAARQLTDYAATYNGITADRLTIEELGKIQTPINQKIKREFAVYKANQAIGAYAKALSALSAAGSRSEIDLASAKLYGAISSINTQYKTINENTTDLFSSADLAFTTRLISEIGSVIVEEKRKEAIKNIVNASDSKIATLCDIIDKQLEDSGIYEGINLSRNYVLTEEMKEYKSKIQKETTLEWRRQELKKILDLKVGADSSKLLIQNAQKAIRAVKASHAAISTELANNKFSSEIIAAAIGRLKEINEHYDDYETLLLECKKIEKDSKGVISCADKK